MCPTHGDHQQGHQQDLTPFNGRPHSTSSAVEEDGFSVWRGRRIRKDVGSWPCDTIELEVGLFLIHDSGPVKRLQSILTGRGRKLRYDRRPGVGLMIALVITYS